MYVLWWWMREVTADGVVCVCVTGVDKMNTQALASMYIYIHRTPAAMAGT